jgi:hypothetical protein
MLACVWGDSRVRAFRQLRRLSAAFGLEALELVQRKAGFLRVCLQKLLDLLAVVEMRIRRSQTRQHRPRL